MKYQNLYMLIIIVAFASSCIKSSQIDFIEVQKDQIDTNSMVFNYMYNLAKKKPPKQLKQSSTLSECIHQRQYYKSALLKSLSIDSLSFYSKRPVNARFVGNDIEKKKYTIKHLVFKSFADLWVTANLYIPKNVDFPRPAIAYFNGHTGKGKSSKGYQTWMQNFARMGYVVLSIDEIGAGERVFVGQSNSYIYLSGLSAGGVQIKEAISSIDYLFSIPEIVDTSRVGATGRSGGGFQSFFISAIDERISCAAPVMFVSNYSDRLASKNLHTMDNYIISPRLSFEYENIFSLIAPRPVFIGAGTNDFFQIDSLKSTMRRVERIYELYNKPEDLGFLEVNIGHKDTLPHREAVYKWFNMHFNIEMEGKEIEEEKMSAELLNCNLSKDTLSTLATLAYNRSKNLPIFQDKSIKSSLASLLGINNYPSSTNQVKFSFIDDTLIYSGFKKYKYLVESDENVFIKINLYTNGKKSPSVIILEEDKQIIQSLLKMGYNVAYCQFRMGNNKGNKIGFFKKDQPEYRDFCNSIILGYPLAGQKVTDIKRCIDFIEHVNGLFQIKDLILLSSEKTESSMIALYTAVIDERIKTLILNKPLISFKADSPDVSEWYNWQLALYVPEILKYGDVEDLLFSIRKRKVYISNVVNTANQKLALEIVREKLSKTRNLVNKERIYNNFDLSEILNCKK